MSEKNIDLDEVLQNFGLKQWYHVKFAILIMIAFATNSMYSFNYVFAVEDVKYRCITQNDSNAFCTYKSNDTCEEWIYENPDSFVADFDLACQDWKRTTVGTVHSFGYMWGLLIIGPISDRLGRKTAVVLTCVLGAVFGTLRSFSPWYFFYLVMEFLEAAFGDSCSPMFVLSLEFVPAKKRTIFALVTNLGYTMGRIILASTAWAVPYWRTFLRVMYMPKGRKEEAISVLEKIARTNKVKLDRGILDKLPCEKEQKSTRQKDVSFSTVLKHTFKSSVLRCRFFICLVWWMTSTFVSYGLTINSVSLDGNKYINFMLLSVVEIPATFIAAVVMIRYNRKKPLIACFLIGAVFCLAQPFMPPGLPWLLITMYLVGSMMSNLYLTITYLYTSELFPTYTRNSMHALCSSLGRIGSIVAPQTPLLIPYWSGLPSFVFGLSALFAGLLTFLVPDVGTDALPDTVKEAEALGKPKEMKESVDEEINLSK